MKPGLHAIAAIVLFTACPAQAQLTVGMSKVTCRQFGTYEITDARIAFDMVERLFQRPAEQDDGRREQVPK